MQQQYGPGDKMSNLQVPHPQMAQQQPPHNAPRGMGPQTPPKSPQHKQPSPGPFPEQRLSHEQVIYVWLANVVGLSNSW